MGDQRPKCMNFERFVITETIIHEHDLMSIFSAYNNFILPVFTNELFLRNRAET